MNTFEIIAITAVVSWRPLVMALDAFNAARNTLRKLEDDCEKLNVKVALLEERVDLLSVSPAEQDGVRFERLPDLTAETLAKLDSDTKLNLLLMTFTDTGTPLVYEVAYVHREVTYRTSGERDPIAYGRGRFEDEEKFEDVRILFADKESTGSMRGLSMEGEVKGNPSPFVARDWRNYA